ncbi:unnamed protein product, partial [Ranitomeya imitator]
IRKIIISQPSRGPSAYIPEKEFGQTNDVVTLVNRLMAEYSTSGRLDNITRVMSLHPQYLESFLRTQFYMLRGSAAPVLVPDKHACGRVSEHRRILRMAERVGLCAAEAKKSQRNQQAPRTQTMKLVITGENNWSLAELVHAVVLLAHYHALASFVFGSGINPDRDPEHSNGHHLVVKNKFCICDLANDNSIENWGLMSNSTENTDYESEIELLMEKMKKLQEEREEEEASQEEMATRFEKEKKESLLVMSGAFDDDVVSMSNASRYIEDPGFGYKDFARRGEEHLPTFRAHDYSWEDHGFSLVNRLYSDIGHLLDDKFRMVYNLTYNTMATHEDVDTTMLRRALFNYVHCMFGIRYDDYDYGEVNQLLERSLKVYIKTVTCYPERATMRMYDGYWRQFKHSEKVHVNLLLMEARMQAELLYALRAITRHLT